METNIDSNHHSSQVTSNLLPQNHKGGQGPNIETVSRHKMDIKDQGIRMAIEVSHEEGEITPYSAKGVVVWDTLWPTASLPRGLVLDVGMWGTW